MPKTLALCPACGGVNRVPFEAPVGKAPVCGKCKTELPVHDGVNELSATDLAKLIQKSPLPVAVDFWAPWCGPCKVFAPTFKEAAKQFAEKIVFAKVNTEAHPSASTSYGVRGIPTVALFKNGVEKGRQSGAMPLSDFVAWLKQYS